MDTRSKKYHEKNQSDNGNKKGSANKAGYDEQNELTSKSPKENPAPSETDDKKHARVGTDKNDQKAKAENSGKEE